MWYEFINIKRRLEGQGLLSLRYFGKKGQILRFLDIFSEAQISSIVRYIEITFTLKIFQICHAYHKTFWNVYCLMTNLQKICFAKIVYFVPDAKNGMD